MLKTLISFVLLFIVSASGQNTTSLQELCCKFFNENFNETYPCCTNGTDLAITSLDFANEIDQETKNKECCAEFVQTRPEHNYEGRVIINPFNVEVGVTKSIVPAVLIYNTLKSASEGFYNLLSKIAELDPAEILIKFKGKVNTDVEIEKLRKDIEELKTILEQKLFTISPIETTTTLAPSVGSSEDSSSDSTIYILIACVTALLLILIVSAGFLIYNRTVKPTLNSSEKKSQMPKVVYEAPEYEYIRYHDNNVVPNIHFSAIFPTAPKLDSNLNSNGGICHNSESNHSIQISSIYNEAIDAADDLNDFYSQVGQVDSSKNEVSQIKRTSDLYATM